MQIIGCRLRLGFWPQQVNHDVPVQPMSGGEGEQFHQCLGFAEPPAICNRLSGDADREATQQDDAGLRWRGRLSHRRIFSRRDIRRKAFWGRKEKMVRRFRLRGHCGP